MLKRFFILCSGADKTVLADCSHGEQEKFVGIGATVFFTAVMAFFAASYALFTVFENYLMAALFGAVWALLIFNLDRFIVSTMRKSGSIAVQILRASPRIILAVIIAAVISKPLELRLFQKEIDRELLSMQNELSVQNRDEIAGKYAQEMNRLEDENAAMRNEIQSKQAEVKQAYDAYISEAEGTAGTRRLGKGPVYAEKRTKHDELVKDLNQTSANFAAVEAENLEKLDELRSRREAEIEGSQPIINNYDGLMARLEGLGKLPGLPRLFIFFLFIAIETAPVFAKLISPKGDYDHKLESQELALAKNLEVVNSNNRELAATQIQIDLEVQRTLREDESVIQHRKQRARIFLNNTADKYYDNKEAAV